MRSTPSTELTKTPSSELATLPVADPSSKKPATPDDNPVVSFAKPMVPKEVFDTDKRLKMLNVPRAEDGSSLMKLVPEVSDASSRKSRIAAHIGRSSISGKSLRKPGDKNRLNGPAENIRAWRTRMKLGKLSLSNAEANNIATSFSHILKEELVDPDGETPRKVVHIDQDKYDRLSHFEKKRTQKVYKRYNKLQRRIKQLELGRKIPFTDKRIMGLEQLVAGSEEEQATNVLERLDKRQAELYEQTVRGREPLQDLINVTMAKWYKEDLESFKKERGRRPYPIEDARLKIEAIEKTHAAITGTK